MQRISRDHHTAYLAPTLAPIAMLKSGEEALVETYDAFLGHWEKGQWPKELGSVTGPIEIEGAQPGDTLKVELLDITPLELKPGRGAVHHTKGGMGFLPEEFTEHYPVVYAIRDGHLVHPTGLRIPLDPSLGFIGTTFTKRQKTSSDSGPYGGDIDMKELRAGSTISACVRAWCNAMCWRHPCCDRRRGGRRHGGGSGGRTEDPRCARKMETLGATARDDE